MYPDSVKVLSSKTHALAHRASSIYVRSIFFFSKKKKAFTIRFPHISNQEGHGSESAPTRSHTLLPFPSYQHVPMISTISQIYNRNIKTFCKPVLEQYGDYTVSAVTVIPNIIVRIGPIQDQVRIWWNKGSGGERTTHYSRAVVVQGRQRRTRMR